MEPTEPFGGGPELSVLEFQALRRLFNEIAGLRFEHTALPQFRRRLAARLPLHDLETYRDYLRLLQNGGEASPEMAAALDLLTSGETYFFRHEEQLALLEHTILPAIAASNAKTRHLSVWSAGCSSGEEAYTVAIQIVESGLFDGWKVRVLGNDLSHERVEHARQGCYFQGAFRTIEPHLWKKHFQKNGRIWQINENVRSLCRFSPLNLLSPELAYFVGRVDLILCRNVLIYLDESARQRVLLTLADHLVPGGFLLLGHSESLKFLDAPLDWEGLHHDLGFRKPLRGGRRGDF